MITRYALFEGAINPGQTDAFRAAVLKELVPKWQAFPGALAVRVTFADERDDGAPEYPLILAVDYPDRAAVTTALNSPARQDGKAATDALLPRFFTGRIHHHITQAHAFAV
jgi:quinol monooxygenase YgiN